MKKILALSLSLLLLFSTGLAEPVIFGTVNDQPLYVSAPEGYTVALQESEAGAYALVTCGDEMSVQFAVGIAYSEEFAGYTMDIDTLSEEQKANVATMLSPDFNKPAFTYFKTETGLSVLLVDETESQSEYAYILTIYDGYFVEVDLFKASEVSESDVQLALTVLESISR